MKDKTPTFQQIIPESISTKFYGFIYRISWSDGFYYIGQKSFRKGLDWNFYKSSSKKVQERLKTDFNTAKFEVLCYCKTKGSLNYEETKKLFSENALEDPRSLNDNICGRYYRRNYKPAVGALELNMNKVGEFIENRKELLERLKQSW